MASVSLKPGQTANYIAQKIMYQDFGSAFQLPFTRWWWAIQQCSHLVENSRV